MKLLDLESILEIHTAGLKRYRGLPGMYPDSDDKVQSILSQQFPVFGIDRYPTVFDKAAALLYFFAKGHCFPDGNKRVAIMAAIIFLDVNCFETTFSNEDGYQMTMEVSSSQIDDGDRDNYIRWIAGWFKENSKQRKKRIIGRKVGNRCCVRL